MGVQPQIYDNRMENLNLWKTNVESYQKEKEFLYNISKI